MTETPPPPIDVKMSVQELEPNEIDVYDVAKTSIMISLSVNMRHIYSKLIKMLPCLRFA